MIKDDELLQNLKNDIEDAQGYDSDYLADKRAKALDYYFGKMKQPVEGRSAIVSNDVSDTVNALMSQATSIYKGSNIEFPAANAEDEEQAQLESDFIQTILENNDQYKTFRDASFDAFLQGNGWIKVYIDEQQEVINQYFDNVQPEVVVEIQAQAEAEGLEVNWESEALDNGNFNIKFKFTRTDRTLMVDCISPDVMLYSATDEVSDIQKLRLIAERKLYTVSDLIDMGMSKQDAESLPDFGDEYWSAAVARTQGYKYNSDSLSSQAAARLKETFICYYLVDMQGNGTLERYRIHFAGDHIINKEPANFVPYSTGSPLPIPHRVEGQGMYEIMRQVQDSKTGILRNYMDNLTVQNGSRIGYLEGEVDVDDLHDGRINGTIAMQRPDALIPLPSNDIGGVCIQGLNYLDTVRTSRGGAALDLNNSEMQIASSSAAAAVGEFAAKEKMANYYCKNMAQSLFKDAFLLCHRTLREQMPGKQNAKIKGQWTETDPSQWPERKSAKITIGMSETEKQKRAANLGMMSQKIEEWIANGQEGIITDKGKYFNVLADWLKASDITDNAEEYITNPESPEAQQAAQAAAQAQQEQAQQMQQQQQAMLEMQLNMQRMLEQMKADNDQKLKEMDLRFKYFDTMIDAEMKEADLTVNSALKIAGSESKQ